MRLLALLTDGSGARGGIARYNSDLMRALSTSPEVTSVLALPRYGRSGGQLEGKICELPPKAERIPFILKTLQIAAWHRYDAIFCGHLFMTPLAAMVARMTRTPLWVQVHGIEAWTEPKTSVGNALRTASLVTSVSRYTRSRLLEWCDISPERVRVLPNTVSTGYRHQARRADLLERYGLGGRKVILTVGRLSASERYKGHDRVIEALPRVSDHIAEVVYLVVGDGDDIPRLREAAVSAGVASRVVFAGDIHQDELSDYFALADVFAMPSTGEGFGIVFLEAAASGVPVIGGNCDGSIDALADGRIGLLVDPCNPDQIADAIVTSIEGKASADPASVGRFTFDAFAEHVRKLLAEIS